MLPGERVIKTIKHENRDRMPLYGWLDNNEFKPKLEKHFGSIQNFEDKYEFDLVHLSSGVDPFNWELINKEEKPIEPELLLDIPLTDPHTADYSKLKADIAFYKESRGRFTYIQTPGFFECYNGPFGIQEHLMNLLIYPNEIKELYKRQAEWTKKFASNVLELGIDMIHLSDDWGAQKSLLFSPAVFKDLIYPFHCDVVQYVKKAGGFASLHSDGNISSVLSDIVKIGYDVIHPFQESAGMDLSQFKSDYMDKFTVMGGIDVQSTLGFNDYGRLEGEIRRIISQFKNKGLILCTTHKVQPHCEIEELIFAYDLICKLIRE